MSTLDRFNIFHPALSYGWFHEISYSLLDFLVVHQPTYAVYIFDVIEVNILE